MCDKKTLPPIGIMPMTIWIDNRIIDLHNAIDRYRSLCASGNIIKSWQKEIEFLTNLKKCQNNTFDT